MNEFFVMKTRLPSFLLILLFSSFSFLSSAQTGDCVSDRYEERVFNQIKVTKDITFGSVYNVTDPLQLFPVDIKLDFYEPAPTEEYLEERPLVVMMFGGGFVLGDKGDADMEAWCDSLAHLGYACASIDYRLDNIANMGLSSDATVRAAYRAIQDARAAIRFLLEDPNGFGFFIDRDHIYTGGESAGAITAIHTAFMEESERPGATYGSALSPDLGCLDCSGNDYDQQFDIKGVLDLWGATLTLDMIDAAEQIPMCIIHGTADDVVLYDTGKPFLNFYPTFPTMFGALPMHNHMDNLNIYNEFYPYDGEGHVFYGIPAITVTFPNDLWIPVYNQGREFFHTIITHDSPMPSGDADVCIGETVTYTVPEESTSTYCWDVTNGTIISSLDHEITIQWNNTGTGTVTITEENYIDVVGNPTTLDITIHDLPTIDFSYSNNEFDFTFSDQMTGNTSWFWDFGDGATSIDSLPTHTFATNGDYTTTLTLTDEFGCENTGSEITEVRVCNPPTNPMSSFITINDEVRVKIRWTNAVDFYRYQLRYRPLDSSTWILTGSTPGKDFLTIPNLTFGETYQYQIRTLCNGNFWSAWNYANTATFTYDPCFYPENVNVVYENQSTGKVRVTLDANPDASKYNVKYKEVGQNTWTQVGTINDFKVISGLNPNATYNFRIRSYCDFWGTFSPAFYFSTNAQRNVSANFEESLQIYPNPVKDHLNIILTQGEITEVFITDLLGKRMKSIMLNSSNDLMKTLDVSSFSSGQYFIQIRYENGDIESQKFIKL